MKKRKKQKTTQLRLFDNCGTALEPCHDIGNEPGKGQVVDFLSRLAEQKDSTNRLLDKIMTYGLLNRAIQEVKTNKGACGVDGKRIAQTLEWFKDNHERLITDILEQRYKVNPVGTVEIPKPNGGVRMLVIPTVLDRIIQQAIHRQLSVLYDPLFSESSYGFRPHRSAHDAVKQASIYIQEGNCWVVDIDMAKYFDTIQHDRVMESMIKFIEGKLKLKVNRDKRGVRLCEEVTYLGYAIGKDGRIRVSKKSMKRLKQKIVKLTKLNLGLKFQDMIKNLNLMIQGWGVYYSVAETYLSDIKKADRNIRNRLRCYRIKQAGNMYGRLKMLRKLELREQTCWNTAYYRQGYWAMSSHPKLRNAMGLNWFVEQGLRSLEHVVIRYDC